MIDNFSYDVFISHSSTDKLIVRKLAQRLKDNGLRVWFDEWEIKPGDMIGLKLEQGLEQARVLVLCMSQNAFASEWVTLERHTTLFRDPTNLDRRFIPVRLDNTEIKDILKQFAYIDWNTGDQRSLEDVVNRLNTYLCELNIQNWQSKWVTLLKNPGRSQRSVVGQILDAFLDLLEVHPFHGDLFHQAMLDLISGIVAQREYYELLSRLRAEVEETWFAISPVTVDALRAHINEYKEKLSSTLRALGANGVRILDQGDTVLLYAFSESVHATLIEWLSDRANGILKLVFCQCLWKLGEMDQPFREALFWANKISDPKARITFVTDAGISNLLKSGVIKKVLFGAYQWGWLSTRRAWFTNTPGTLAIAAVARMYDVPIFVLAEKEKYSEYSPDSSESARNHTKQHGVPPQQTDKGLAIDHQDPGVDEMDSSDIPFVLITEEGEFACGDFDLRKRNHVVIDTNQLSITKRTTDSVSARAERVTLQVLNRLHTTSGLKLQVPLLINEKHAWNEVCMERKNGIRVHDLVATVNELIRRGTIGKTLERANELRTFTFEWALTDVQTWQSQLVQNPLHRAFGSELMPYEFTVKFLEAVKTVSRCQPALYSVDNNVIQEVQAIGERLQRRASVSLRDATLKNQIFELPVFVQLPGSPYLDLRGHFPTADAQWFDTDTAIRLLSRIPDEIPWERIRRHIWHVDFELTSRLTTPEDDFVHVLALEIFKLNYDQIVAAIAERLPNEDPANFHDTILFRAFRAWARRLAYAYERPDIFATRYRHELLSHYYNLAMAATEHISDSSHLISFMHQTTATSSQ